jgi:DNA-binding Xre family transcriptional regulator/biotin operon repressor
MIKIKLQETARTRGLTTAYTLQKALNCSPTMASRLWNGRFKQIGIETIGSLCDLFDCQPNDLFENQKSQSSNIQSSNNTQSDTTQSNNAATEKPVKARTISKSAEGMLSTAEVAERLGLSRKSVNDYIIDGKLKAVKGKQNHNFVSESNYLEFENWYQRGTRNNS